MANMKWNSASHPVERTEKLKDMGSVITEKFSQIRHGFENSRWGSYLGTVTQSQLSNIQYVVQGHGSPSRTARYSPQRGRYFFGDKEEELARRVQRDCTERRVCAFIINDKKAVQEKTLVTKYALGEVKESPQRFQMHCFGGKQGLGRDVGWFGSRESAVEHLNTAEREDGSPRYKGTDRCLVAKIEEIPSSMWANVKKRVKKTVFDHVHYFTLTEKD